MEELHSLFAKNLKQIREQKKFTQEALAEACELSVRTIAEIERAKKAPSFGSLARLCSVLRVNAFEFFLPLEGAESFSKRRLLASFSGDVARDLQKRLDQYLK